MVYSLHLPLSSDCGWTSKGWWQTKSTCGSALTSTYFNSRTCTSEQKRGALRVHQQALVSGDAWRWVMHHDIRRCLCTIMGTPPIVTSPAKICAPCHIPICQGRNQRGQKSPSTLSQRINEQKTHSHTVDRHGPIPTLVLTHHVSMCCPRNYWAWCSGCSVKERARMCSAKPQQTVNITGGENGRTPNCQWRGFMF